MSLIPGAETGPVTVPDDDEFLQLRRKDSFQFEEVARRAEERDTVLLRVRSEQVDALTRIAVALEKIAGGKQ